MEAIITAKTEHKAVLNAVKSYQELLPVLYVDVDKKGVVDLKHLEFLLQSHPNALVTLMHANNEIGTINPIRELAASMSKASSVSCAKRSTASADSSKGTGIPRRQAGAVVPG